MLVKKSTVIACSVAMAISACGRLEQVGQAPSFNAPEQGNEHFAMMRTPVPTGDTIIAPNSQASLWNFGRKSLLGNQRAQNPGDIVTVVIEIDDRAELSSDFDRSQTGSVGMGVPQLLGIPQRINEVLPEGATMDNAISATSNSTSTGGGSVKRNEKLTYRVAATVVDVLPNGVLHIQGSQEIRVNYELRELLVKGYVRPHDISRQNEISSDKIASARISVGGRGRVSEVQQPAWGQQITDIIKPF